MEYNYFQINNNYTIKQYPFVNKASKIRQLLNYKRRDLLFQLGLSNGFYKNARGARILIYHGICLRDHTRFNPIFLTNKIFEEHLKFYKKHFNVVSLEEFYAGQFRKDCFNVCITFDDGYANNHKYVLPLMEKYEVPVAFFITAIREAGYNILWNDFLGIITKYGPDELRYDNIDFHKDAFGRYVSIKSGLTLADHLKEAGFKKKEEMMTKLKSLFVPREEEEDFWMQMNGDQIRELASSPFATIGSHSYYHNRMDKLPIEDAIQEMVRSKQYLERLTGKKINALAFPYGNYSRNLVEEARKIGYTQLLAMDFYYMEDKQDSSMRERFTVNPYISVNNQMHATITGRYE
jgi:peptidoglycan/xylan/chitin deacetylase (PgdA/CDA1 family)